MPRSLLAALCVVATPLAAQSGTTVWSMHMRMPDSMQAKAGGLAEIDMRMTMATDGSRLGFQIDFGESMAAAMDGIDFTAIRFQTVVHAGGDSVSVGLVMPPELAAVMGGGIGFRVDVAIPDSLDGLGVPNIDSMMAATQGEEPQVVNTGRTSMVAGISCEEWEVTPREVDSIPFAGKIQMCLADRVPALHAFTSLFESFLPDFGVDFGEMKAMGRKWFGGRDLTAIRTVIGADNQIVVQLESFSNTAPDASFFVLPEGLTPFPLDALKGMMPAGMQAGT